MKIETKRQILIGLYVAFMLIVNTVGTKIMSIAGIRASVGILYMPLLFIISDTISEVFGKEEANRTANISTFLLSILVLSFYIAIALPPHPDWGFQSEFKVIYSQSLRMSAASVAAFFLSQRLDIDIFSKMRKRTSQKHLYARSIISTALSQAVDTFIFMFLAFYRMNETYTLVFVLKIALPYYLLKLVLSAASAPLCYLGVSWCRKGCRSDADNLAANHLGDGDSASDEASGLAAEREKSDLHSEPSESEASDCEDGSADDAAGASFHADDDSNGAENSDEDRNEADKEYNDGNAKEDDEDDDEDDDEWARKWRLEHSIASRDENDRLSDESDDEVDGDSDADNEWARKWMEKQSHDAYAFDEGSIGSDNSEICEEPPASDAGVIVEESAAEPPEPEEDPQERERKEKLKQLLLRNIPGIARTDDRPEVTMDSDEDLEVYEDEESDMPESSSNGEISEERDEFANPNVCVQRDVMVGFDVAHIMAEAASRQEWSEESKAGRHEDYRDDDIEHWWEDFSIDPDSFLSIDKVNLSYREENAKKKAYAALGRSIASKGKEYSSKRAEKRYVRGKSSEEANSCSVAFFAFEDIESIGADEPSLVVEAQRTLDREDQGQWWDEFEYDPDNVLDWNEVNLSYRQLGRTKQKAHFEGLASERNGVEQTAPDWALGEWYVDEGEFGVQRVVTFRRNCYINQNDEDIGLIEYNSISENAALEYYIVKRSDTDFSVEQHDGDFDLIAYHLKKCDDGFKIAISVLGSEAQESDFRMATRKDDGVSG
ncbi:MAG TPA: hypothetical protein DCO86_04145 [Spirochaetaceae bacterium]|nr:hypothetical protein [Spirochaetaceae bacterium]